jgi:uncharacterized repeat protein (TIGR01451 family)
MNVTTGTGYQNTVAAQPGQTVAYKIVVTAENAPAIGIMVSDVMPAYIHNVRDLDLDGKSIAGDLDDGINIAALDEGESAVITYTAVVGDEGNFGYGQTALTNVATATVDGNTDSAEATVNVSRQAVYAATTVSTGFDSNAGIAIAAGLLGLLLAAGYALKSNNVTSRVEVSELDKKIAYIKSNNLVG